MTLFFSSKKIYFSLMCLFFIGVVSWVNAAQFSSSNFQIERASFGSYGGFESSASFQGVGVGEYQALGQSSSTSFIHQSGPLYYSTLPVSSVSGGGGGGGTVFIGGPTQNLFITLPTTLDNGRLDEVLKQIHVRDPLHSAPDVSFLSKLDLTGDGFIELADFSIVMYYFGKRMAGDEKIFPDFNNDRLCDITDVALFIRYYGTSIR